MTKNVCFLLFFDDFMAKCVIFMILTVFSWFWPKLTKNDRNLTFFDCFWTSKIDQNWPKLTKMMHFLTFLQKMALIHVRTKMRPFWTLFDHSCSIKAKTRKVTVFWSLLEKKMKKRPIKHAPFLTVFWRTIPWDSQNPEKA